MLARHAVCQLEEQGMFATADNRAILQHIYGTEVWDSGSRSIHEYLSSDMYLQVMGKRALYSSLPDVLSYLASLSMILDGPSIDIAQ
jgi:hypothetical protein